MNMATGAVKREVEVAPGGVAGAETKSGKWSLAALVRFGSLCFQVGLLVLIARTFRVESKSFLHLMGLTAGGFVVHHLLPDRYRMPFFGALSIAGIALVLGAENAAWLSGLIIALIGICHLPLPFRARVGILVVAGVFLSLLRSDVIPAPFSSVVWPIFGTMVMFRLIIYMYDLGNKSAPFSPARAVSYFFLLPNVCFTMFPVVDYQTFCRSHYNTDDAKIYQDGVIAILRGMIQLILYRLIYQNFSIDPTTIQNASDAWHHVAINFLFYFRIVGSFSIGIGILRLFGFNMPAPNFNYLLSSSFTDWWRRANIYWKDFMLKVFFQPTYLVVNRGGNAMRAMGAGLIVTFVVTWLLHSYQWYWIRDSFPVTWQDIVMWGWLGVCVWIAMILETKKPKKKSLKKPVRTVKSTLIRTAKNVALVTAMGFMWSVFWTSPSWDDTKFILTMFTQVSLGDVAFILLTILAFAAVTTAWTFLPSENIDVNAVSRTKLVPKDFWRRSSAVIGVSGGLLLVGLNPAMLSFNPKLADVVDRVRDNRLSERDAGLLKQGYYEDLADATRFSPELQALYNDRPKDWDINPLVYQIDGYPDYGLMPSKTVQFKGSAFTTNKWGMRDREYTLEKPAGTYRIAVIGQSPEQGSGVTGDETYENLIEERLNKEKVSTSSTGPKRFEVLNFANGGYGPLHKLAHIEKHVYQFKPDAILYVSITDVEWAMNEVISAHQHKLGLDIVPFPYVHEIFKKADVEQSTPKIIVQRRIEPVLGELVAGTYKRIAEGCKERGIRPIYVMMAQPEDNSSPAGQKREIEMARAAGMEIIEVRDVYDGVDDVKKYWIARWDHHPNPEAHRMIAGKLYPRLTQLLGL